MSKKIRVGITQGDSNGVGCEIILKALAHEAITDLFTPVVIGSKYLVEDGVKRYLDEGFPYVSAESASEIKDGAINLLYIKEHVQQLSPGTSTKEGGKEAVEALNKAVGLLKNGDIDVLVTAPICKETAHDENFPYPGHTEFLEHELGAGEKSLMILTDEKLRVVPLTIHIPLAEVADNISKEKLRATAQGFEKSLKIDFGIERPKIAILGLNPHSGDGGLLGKEESEVLIPAIKELRDEGMLIFGPFAADGFFGHGEYNKYDGIISMYHDQGLIPFKTLCGGSGVNFTAGLPYVRTSPDHGTGFDIAGKGEADETSMRNAIYMAIDIFRRRKEHEKISTNPLQIHFQARPDREERHEGNVKKQVIHADKEEMKQNEEE